jgi:thiol:disulfide interchange protein DsbD
LFTVVVLFIVSVSYGQVLTPVKWSFSFKSISKSEAELIFTATIDKGWHLYSQDIPENGPIPTKFTFEKGMGFLPFGKISEPVATEVFDKQFNMKVKYFGVVAEFRQKVKVMSAKPVEVKGTVEFMCCNDESCLPPTEVPFEFKLPASK